jgi:DNA-binding response OmpR family regulator
MKIFYAEDDIMMQKMVAYSLIRMGHEIVTVDDGGEALDLLRTESFDFFILDVFLPKHSGLDLARYIRIELKSKIPIIILSRSNEKKLMDQAEQIGVNEFIKKPIEPDFLLLKLKKYTGVASG